MTNKYFSRKCKAATFPLMFSIDGCEEYPISVHGSGVWISFGDDVYLLHTHHSVTSQGHDLTDLLYYQELPGDTHILKSEIYTIQTKDCGIFFSDFVFRKIHRDSIFHKQLLKIAVPLLRNDISDLQNQPVFVCGAPRLGGAGNCDSVHQIIRTPKHGFTAIVKAIDSKECRLTLHVDNFEGLVDNPQTTEERGLCGMSGGGLFVPDEKGKPILAGVLIQGSVRSKRIEALSTSAIIPLIHLAEMKEQYPNAICWHDSQGFHLDTHKK